MIESKHVPVLVVQADSLEVVAQNAVAGLLLGAARTQN